MHTTSGVRIYQVFNYLFFSVVTVIMLLPFLNVLTMSLEPEYIAVQQGLHLFPREVTLEAYRSILTRSSIILAFRNSVIVSLSGAALGTIVTAMYGYAIAQDELPGVRLFSYMLVFTMMFSGGLIPSYLLIRDLGLINNLAALVLPALITGYNTILMRSFFRSIPPALSEAAMIDGCTEWQTFFRIIIPLSKPIFATIFLFYMVARWNSYIDAMLYMTRTDLRTLQVLLREILILSDMVAENATDVNLGKNVTMATAIVSIVPILCVYPFLQKYFTKGIMLGGVKG